MDKVAKLFSEELEAMCSEYQNKIYSIPSWQLDNNLPDEIKAQTIDKKINYLIEKYKKSNPIYLLLNDDKNLMEQRGNNLSQDELKSLKIDPIYLESKGLSEKQIDDFYKFAEQVKALF